MKKINLVIPSLLIFAFISLVTIPGCGLIENIFKAGMWVGIIGVVLVIGIIALLFKSFGGK